MQYQVIITGELINVFQKNHLEIECERPYVMNNGTLIMAGKPTPLLLPAGTWLSVSSLEDTSLLVS